MALKVVFIPTISDRVEIKTEAEPATNNHLVYMLDDGYNPQLIINGGGAETTDWIYPVDGVAQSWHGAIQGPS